MLRFEIIQRLIDENRFNNYLEIGVAKGKCFSKINIRNKIGVDPKVPTDSIKELLDSNVQYIQTTSDDFFNNYFKYSQNYMDITFVDGFHSFDQSLNDILNCIKYLSPNGIIVVHDCNPTDPLMATQLESLEDSYNFIGPWTGDVWKSILYLRLTRKDLEICVINCDAGCGIIRKKSNIVYEDISSKDKIIYDYVKKLTYEDLSENRKEFLNLISEEEYFNILNI